VILSSADLLGSANSLRALALQRAKKNDGAPTPKEPGPRPADKVERRSVASLVPAARNHRTHGAGQVDQIAASIREWGWMVSVLVNERGGLINGGFSLPLSC
jgi:hypothetical protein